MRRDLRAQRRRIGIVNADHRDIAARLPAKDRRFNLGVVLHRAVPVQMIRRDMISTATSGFSDGAKSS